MRLAVLLCPFQQWAWAHLKGAVAADDPLYNRCLPNDADRQVVGWRLYCEANSFMKPASASGFLGDGVIEACSPSRTPAATG